MDFPNHVQDSVEARSGGDDFTRDGTVDLKGNPVLRSKTGGWRACSFVVAYEVLEWMAFYGISSNLVLYLTIQLHQGTVTASNNVTNWVGTVWLTPILGSYVADEHLGRFWTTIIASAIYLSGMCLLTLTVSIPSLRVPPCHQTNNNAQECTKASTLPLALFYTALYILAIGIGGTNPIIQKSHKQSFSWWTFSIFFGTLFANTFLVYIQENVGWSLGFGLPTAALLVSTLIFLAGTPFYRHRQVKGSPFTGMARVLVAAVHKWRVNLPNDPSELYELDLAEYAAREKYRAESTPSLRFLNKAVVETGSKNPWMLCSVTPVEETRQTIQMIPILIAQVVPCTMVAQVNTLFS